MGQIAPYDIRASYDVDVVDEALTEERRQQARDKILDVYVHDSERRLNLSQEIADVFRDGRQAAELAAGAGADPGGAVRQRLVYRPR